MKYTKKLTKKEKENLKKNFMKLQKAILNKYRNLIILSFISKDLRQSFKNLNNMKFDDEIYILRNKEKSKAVKVNRIIKNVPKPKYKKVIHKIEFYGVEKIAKPKKQKI